MPGIPVETREERGGPAEMAREEREDLESTPTAISPAWNEVLAVRFLLRGEWRDGIRGSEGVRRNGKLAVDQRDVEAGRSWAARDLDGNVEKSVPKRNP